MIGRDIFWSVIGFLAVCYAEDKLLQVIEILRHGPRGPLNQSYDSKEEMEIAGELTEVGKYQMFQLGSQIRREYITNRDFLSLSFNHSEIIAYSTDLNRTITSATAHLLGMYPSGSGPELENVNQSLLYPPYQGFQATPIDGRFSLPGGVQVFPVHTLTPQGSIIPFTCPNLDKMISSNLRKYGYFVHDIDTTFSQLYADVSAMINEPIRNMHDLMAFEDVMTSDIFQGRPLPPTLTDDQINQIKTIRAIAWFLYQAGEPTRALGSNTAEFIAGSFDSRVNGNNPLKFILLSAHDSTIVRQQLFFNISDHDCLWRQYKKEPQIDLNCEDSPRFGSTLIYELWEAIPNIGENQNGIIDKYYVMIKFNGKYIYLCERKSTQCELSEFLSRVNRQLGSYELMCGIEILPSDQTDVKENLIQTLTFMCILLGLCTGILAFSLYKLRNQQSQNRKEIEEIMHSQQPNDQKKYIELDHI